MNIFVFRIDGHWLMGGGRLWMLDCIHENILEQAAQVQNTRIHSELYQGRIQDFLMGTGWYQSATKLHVNLF